MILSSYTNEDLIKLVELRNNSTDLEIEIAKRLMKQEEIIKKYDEVLSDIIDIANIE